MAENNDAFDKAWAKLAAIPGNQRKCFICYGESQVLIGCEKKEWFGKNEAECLDYVKNQTK